MSAHLSPAPSPRFNTQAASQISLVLRAAQAVRLMGRRFRHAYQLALREETSRRNLRVMDNHMLADIGISRAQADYEADRKPWHLL